MSQNLVRFRHWNDVLSAARRGAALWYEAPLDAASANPAKRVVVKRVYKNGKLRVDPVSNQADPFTCNAGHLYRFRKSPEPSDVVAEYVEGSYRIRWYRDGSCMVTSNFTGALQGEYRDGRWDDLGRLPDDVRTFCLKFRPLQPIPEVK